MNDNTIKYANTLLLSLEKGKKVKVDDYISKVPLNDIDINDVIKCLEERELIIKKEILTNIKFTPSNESHLNILHGSNFIRKKEKYIQIEITSKGIESKLKGGFLKEETDAKSDRKLKNNGEIVRIVAGVVGIIGGILGGIMGTVSFFNNKDGIKNFKQSIDSLESRIIENDTKHLESFVKYRDSINQEINLLKSKK
ncbi:hypothetical protein [Myroides odoratimimus]|uniref:hypothetical protein n=1 Tax=Myroides odoratimimus TaxID=76832 RepID=UPI002577A6E0|nr:hypothetical protein [Myroides odoratimimus]MDM1513571.1 hypothetical protein [Myroides odoratimimus]